MSPTDATVENFGWPCYEGVPRQPGYDGADLSICEGLYGSRPAIPNRISRITIRTRLFRTRRAPPAAHPSLASRSNSRRWSSFPAEYDDALFFADYSRDCIWVMKKDGNPILSPGTSRLSSQEPRTR